MLKLFVEKKSSSAEPTEQDLEGLNNWISDDQATEGQLAVDVYQTEQKIFVQSTIAGVKPENLQISLHHDLLTIKGRREPKDNIDNSQYLYRECYWGSFSRSIILPSEVDNKKIEAVLENGVLTISLIKVSPSPIKIQVKE